MKKSIALFFVWLHVLFLFVIMSARADEDYETKLWVIADSYSVKGYLLGTYPIPDRTDLDLEEVLNQHIDRLFIGSTSITEQEVGSFIQGGISTLQNILPDDLLVKRLEKGLGHELKNNDIKLWLLWLELELKLNNALVNSYELQLVSKAKSLNIEIQELEHYSVMIDRLDSLMLSLSSTKQKALLHELLRKIENKQSASALLQRFQSGEYAREMHTPEHNIYQPIISMIFSEANSKWIEKINVELQAGRVLFALDVRHLNGDMGLINLLREKGFQVYPFGQQSQYSEERHPLNALSKLFMIICMVGEARLIEKGWVNEGKCHWALDDHPWITGTVFATILLIPLVLWVEKRLQDPLRLDRSIH